MLSQAAKEENSQALWAEISHLVIYSTTSLPSKIYLERDLRTEKGNKGEESQFGQNSGEHKPTE